MTTLEYVLAGIAAGLGLSILFEAFRYFCGKDRAASSDPGDDDNHGDEDDDDEGDSEEDDPKEDPEEHHSALHLVDRDGEPLEDGMASSGDERPIDLDDLLSPEVLDDEAEDDEGYVDDDDNDLLAETLISLAVIDDYDGFVDDMLEKTGKIMKHITSIQVALKREEDEDNANLFIVLRHHLQQQMQDYHDIVETVNKYVGRNEDYTDAVVAIEEEIAKVEGYNL